MTAGTYVIRFTVYGDNEDEVLANAEQMVRDYLGPDEAVSRATFGWDLDVTAETQETRSGSGQIVARLTQWRADVTIDVNNTV